jgi:hypothetical protein
LVKFFYFLVVFLFTAQRGDAHVHEDPVEDGHGNMAEHLGHRHGQPDEQEGDDAGDALFAKNLEIL